MKVKIQALHFTLEKPLLSLIEEKAEKLHKVFNRIESCDIILKQEKNELNKNKIVEIILDIPGNRFFSKSQCQTFEEATSTAFDEIRTQLLSRKEFVLQYNRVN